MPSHLGQVTAVTRPGCYPLESLGFRYGDVPGRLSEGIRRLSFDNRNPLDRHHQQIDDRIPAATARGAAFDGGE